MGTRDFGLIDYWRMYKKHGVRLMYHYFLNAHLYDLINKTDTHTWLPKEFYINVMPSFQNGVLYMTSWTSEVSRSFRVLRSKNILGPEYTFIDIGCGKGKVCMMWQLLERKHLDKKVTILGLEYYEPLIDIARQNNLKIFQNEGNFIYADAILFDFKAIKTQLVVYMFNPFDDTVLEQVAINLPDKAIVIYNNPVHDNIFIKLGYEKIYQHFGWHPNAQTIIYKKLN